MMTYGDGVSDVDIPRLLEFHKSHGKLATVTTFRPVSRFGILDIDPANQVLNFIEKPKSDAWASAGFFVFNREVLDYIDGDQTTLEREPLERLAAERQLVAFHHPGFFYAMDTYREFQILNDLWKNEQAPWKVWE
jgi:glucose-1-phosphate cytidylyltransferase